MKRLNKERAGQKKKQKRPGSYCWIQPLSAQRHTSSLDNSVNIKLHTYSLNDDDKIEGTRESKRSSCRSCSNCSNASRSPFFIIILFAFSFLSISQKKGTTFWSFPSSTNEWLQFTAVARCCLPAGSRRTAIWRHSTSPLYILKHVDDALKVDRTSGIALRTYYTPRARALAHTHTTTATTAKKYKNNKTNSNRLLPTDSILSCNVIWLKRLAAAIGGDD